MRSSYSLLQSTKNLSSHNPDWYRQMMAIYQSQSLERREFDALVDEALKRYPDYYPTFQLAVDGLVPKWGGSDEEVREFINRVSNAVPKRIGDELYAQMYLSVECCDYRGLDIFSRAGAEWPRLRSGLDSIRSQFPGEVIINAEAELACRAGDLKTMRTLLPMIGDTPYLDMWHKSQPYFQNCKAQPERFPTDVDSVPVAEAPRT
jgi:hypothetical protein